MRITAKCSCGQVFQVHENFAGTEKQCVYCKRMYQVPEASDAQFNPIMAQGDAATPAYPRPKEQAADDLYGSVPRRHGPDGMDLAMRFGCGFSFALVICGGLTMAFLAKLTRVDTGVLDNSNTNYSIIAVVLLVSFGCGWMAMKRGSDFWTMFK